MLLGFVHLHRGSSENAVREAAQAWSEGARSGRVDLARGTLLSLIEVLIDLKRWDLVREHEVEILSTATGEDPAGRTIAARARALVAQGNGRPALAVSLLEENEETASALGYDLSAARFLHHLGVAACPRGAGRRQGRSAPRRRPVFEVRSGH